MPGAARGAEGTVPGPVLVLHLLLRCARAPRARVRTDREGKGQRRAASASIAAQGRTEGAGAGVGEGRARDQGGKARSAGEEVRGRGALRLSPPPLADCLFGYIRFIRRQKNIFVLY